LSRKKVEILLHFSYYTTPWLGKNNFLFVYHLLLTYKEIRMKLRNSKFLFLMGFGLTFLSSIPIAVVAEEASPVVASLSRRFALQYDIPFRRF